MSNKFKILNTSWGVFLDEMGGISRFTGRFFIETFKPRQEFRELFKQAFIIGYKSLPLVGITAFIMGLVLTIQSRPTLAEFGAQAWLPAMVSVSIVREIGPMITALICAGKIGSSIGAELGSMKVTEQIDAMEVSGTNPFKYLVVTRVLASTFMLPMLVVAADAIGLYGSFLGVNIKGVTSLHLFSNQIFEKLTYGDITPSIIKSVFFGFAIGIVGCYKGYNSNKGTEGVGQSANSAVVVSSLLVFIIDLLAVQISDALGLT
ncbi:MAG: ABC transporter permease [Bacteroidia bacterium]|nr:ABC transporter permease [Bacteroidia bacterium]